MRHTPFTRSSHLLAALVALCTLCVTSLAGAQEGRRTTVITTTPGVLALTTTTGVVMTISDATTTTTSSSSSGCGAFADAEQTTTYMANNTILIDEALAMGEGEALSDLAHMAHIAVEDRAAFNMILRDHREAISTLLHAPDFGQPEAIAIGELVLDAMAQDTALRHYASPS